MESDSICDGESIEGSGCSPPELLFVPLADEEGEPAVVSLSMSVVGIIRE